VTKHLVLLSKNIEKSLKKLGPDATENERAFGTLARDCQHTVSELLNVLDKLKVHEDKCEHPLQQQSSAYETERTQRLRSTLISHLAFQSMDDRKERIMEAHQKTFEWIYSEPKIKTRRWASFIEWLETGSSLYWITGQAGSGKSTLMKYLCRDTRTFSLLNSWSSQHSLVTAAFFFWNSGTSMTTQSLLAAQDIPAT
jgi:hypothetical protein